MTPLVTRILKMLVVLLIPIVLVLGSVRLLTTDAYLTFAYGKPGFPSDTYGFTSRQRFILASTNIHYVRAHLPENELSKQTLNGNPVYNEREVSHMADVQNVFQYVLRIWQYAFVLLLLLGVIFWRSGRLQDLASAIYTGGIVTAMLILSIGLLAGFAWETWFNLFHRFIFVPGSWIFSYSDTLIRLFPAQFWFDATLSLSILSFGGGLLATLLGWKWQHDRTQRPKHVVVAG